MTNSSKIGVVICGGTGTVGQRFVQLLESHPFFYVAGIGASPRSAGKRYIDAVQWKLATPIPATTSNLIVQACDPDCFLEQGSDGASKIMFSGLDSDVAGEVEMSFLKAGWSVFSNAKNYRMEPLIPLIVPTVNTHHLGMIPYQQKEMLTINNNGFIVTNANCSTTGLVVPLRALIDTFGAIDKLIVTTMQAISGAGYPGVPSLDIFDNVVPYISGEEDKLETETLKILGSLSPNQTEFLNVACMKVSAHCNRVAVLDGHTATVSISFASRPPPTPEQVVEVLRAYKCEAQTIGAPSAPPQAIVVHDGPLGAARPQPRLDRDNGGGYSVTVGRVRTCGVFDIKLTLLSHNTVLGAAGSGILNAEVALLKGYLKKSTSQ